MKTPCVNPLIYPWEQPYLGNSDKEIFYPSVILVFLYYYGQTTQIMAYFGMGLQAGRSKTKVWQRANSSPCPYVVEKKQANFLASLFIRTNSTIRALPISAYLTSVL